MNCRHLTTSLMFLATLATSPIVARAAASVRLAGGHPDVASFAALGLTTGVTPSRNLSMRAVLALRNRDQLNQLLSDLQDPNSPDYHRWLATGEFTARFGPTADQIAQVSSWLSSQGFTVTSASAEDRTVRFTGPAALAASAFDVNFAATAGGGHFANLASPSVPAKLAGMIQSIQGLDNLNGFVVPPRAEVALSGSKKNAFGPPDMYAFYDETPLLNDPNGSIDGSGADCIALPEFSDFDDDSVSAFTSVFQLPPLTDSNLTRVTVDSSGINDDFEIETLIDVEYAHTAAQQAPIRVYIDTDADAGTAFTDPLQRAVNDNICGSISLSIGICTPDSAFAIGIDDIYQQAAAQGQTVFAASGDFGAATAKVKVTKNGNVCVASRQRGVNEAAASPNITSIGGTQSKPKFVKATGIVTGPASETVWHESFGSSGGGASQVFTNKPDYQNGVTPNDGVRDIPDISLLAAVKTPGYVLGYTPAGRSPGVYCCAGGTSFGSPYWAGIAALMEQMNGGGLDGRLGLINPKLYGLALSDAVANGIRDVTKGSNGFAGAKGYKALPGYDQATGWGTPDISVFAHAFTGK